VPRRLRRRRRSEVSPPRLIGSFTGEAEEGFERFLAAFRPFLSPLLTNLLEEKFSEIRNT
jgi:hypothetical protein